MIGEDVYYSQSGGIVRGNGGWDKNGPGVKNTREKTFTEAALRLPNRTLVDRSTLTF